MRITRNGGEGLAGCLPGGSDWLVGRGPGSSGSELRRRRARLRVGEQVINAIEGGGGCSLPAFSD